MAQKVAILRRLAAGRGLVLAARETLGFARHKASARHLEIACISRIVSRLSAGHVVGHSSPLGAMPFGSFDAILRIVATRAANAKASNPAYTEVITRPPVSGAFP